MTTYIHYMYRDGNNYKQHGSIPVTAPLTPEQIDTIVATLDEGEYFIPQQVGIDPLQGLFSGIDTDADHPWHELSYDGIEQSEDAFGRVSRGHRHTPETLVAAFTRAAADGWDFMKYDPTA